MDKKERKICIVGPTYPFRGGIAHYTTLLFRNLKNHFTVSFFAFKRQYPRLLFPGKSDKDTSKSPILEQNVELVLNSFNPLSWIRVGLKISRQHPELIIFPWWVSFWAPHFLTIIFIIRSLHKHGRVLFICHNVVGHESNTISRMIDKLVLRRGDVFIAHSEDERHAILKYMPNAEVHVTYHPIYDVFFNHQISRSDARKKLNLSGNIILFFGFVRDYKGLEYLLKAMPMVIESIQATLVIAGEFWNNKQYYTDLIEELGIHRNVIIHDRYIPNEDVPQYFSASNVIVTPYTSVTGSGIVQMAYGAGLPIITTDVGNLSEIVQDGKTGFIVKSQDVEMLAKSIVQYFIEGKEYQFKKNIISYRDKFSWNHLVRIIESQIN